MKRVSYSSSFLKLAGALGLVAVLWGASAQEAGAVRERGTAGTRDRDLWCRNQHATCLNDGYQSCDRGFPTDTPGATRCYEGVQLACDNSFGSDSTCKTQARTAPTRPIPTRPRAPVNR